MGIQNFGVTIDYLRGWLGAATSSTDLAIYVQGQGRSSNYIGIAKGIIEGNNPSLHVVPAIEITKNTQREIHPVYNYILVPSNNYLFYPLNGPEGEIDEANCREALEELRHIIESSQGNNIESARVEDLLIQLEKEAPSFAYIRENLSVKNTNVEAGKQDLCYTEYSKGRY